MKLIALTILISTFSSLIAADVVPASSCAKTLLTKAFECVKKKHTSEAVALYIQVRDHPHAELEMIMEASLQLKSYQKRDDAIVGFIRIINCRDFSESKLIRVGEILLELGAFDEATQAFKKLLDHPIVSSDTQRHIRRLLSKHSQSRIK